ncbi:tripartite tricarboxylate transporter TctB family protein [bacterium]|nr:MAG: tripartite tricarboxylate transporter TctB family protein [bacterium]
MDESTRRLRTLDFFMGIVFAAIGLYVAIEGYNIFVAPELVTVERMTNPGVTTIFIGTLLALLGLVMAIIGFIGSSTPFRNAKQAIPETLRKPTFLKGIIAMACIAVYFFVLWGRIPYVISTFIFLTGMMFIFKAGAWWKIFIISGITVAIVWYVFGELAMVPLP